jgi:MoaA/NifB/PqqE/SkfB family radical SAM enzyme
MNLTTIKTKYTNAQLKIKRKFYSLKDPLTAPNPSIIYLIINSRCNLFCKMCDVGQAEKESQFGQNMLGAEQDMDFDLYKKLIDDVAYFKPIIALTSTEPLLWKRLFDAIEYAKAKGCKVQITTNGILLPQKIDTLIEKKLDVLWVSLDGIESTHDEIRGIEGSYKKTTSGFILAKDKIQERGINHVVSNWNYNEVVTFAKDIVQYQPTHISFSHLNFITNEMSDLHNKTHLDTCMATPTCISSIFPEEIDYKLLFSELKEAENILLDKGVIVSHSPKFNSEEEVRIFYNEPMKIVAKKKCTVPWDQAQFMANGDMILMTRCFHLVMGNIQNKNFTELWNGNNMKNFRKELTKVGMFPACTRCCGVL